MQSPNKGFDVKLQVKAMYSIGEIFKTINILLNNSSLLNTSIHTEFPNLDGIELVGHEHAQFRPRVDRILGLLPLEPTKCFTLDIERSCCDLLMFECCMIMKEFLTTMDPPMWNEAIKFWKFKLPFDWIRCEGWFLG